MDINGIIYHAAKEGKLRRLKLFLDVKPRAEVKVIVSAVTLGSTPLVIACRKGFVDVVNYLLEQCHANVEQVGSVVFDGETVEDAPPLWCAAAAGHFTIVRMLVHHKAMLNTSTKTNSTPLRAACFDGHFQIARFLVEKGADFEVANHHGHTCLMIACYKGHFRISEYLLHCGADVNRQSLKGNTALHDCAESGNLEIFKMLVKKGAKIYVDSRGMTPLLSAAVTGHGEIVDYLINHTSCKLSKKIDALELLGATFVDKHNQRWRAHNYWKQAMLMRCENIEPPLVKPLNQSPIAAYINAIEVTTVDELEELIFEPDAMRMQSLLIRERILGAGHPDNAYYVRFRGAAYADSGQFDRCITLWMYALDVQQQVLEPLNPMIQSSLMSFAELFSYIVHDTLEKSGQMPMTHFRNVLNVFQRATKEIEKGMLYPSSPSDDENANFNRILAISMHLIGLICLLQPNLSSEEDLEFKQAVYTFVHLNPETRKGCTPLHIACYKNPSFIGQYPVFSFPSEEVAKVLLEVGSSPNVMDRERNTALHVITLNEPCPRRIFEMLLNYGAHLDFRNHAGRTALQLCRTRSIDLYPLQFLNLQCLCAQVIRKAEIPFCGLIPKALEKFVDGH